MLEISKLSVSFGGIQALRYVSFDRETGQSPGPRRNGA